MLTSLAFIFLAGLAMAGICGRLGLPRIIGMLFTGILLRPNVFNLLDSSILLISPQLRQMALIIILLKAGAFPESVGSAQVGRPAVMMSFVPASFEILAFLLFGHLFWEFHGWRRLFWALCWQPFHRQWSFRGWFS